MEKTHTLCANYIFLDCIFNTFCMIFGFIYGFQSIENKALCEIKINLCPIPDFLGGQK